MPAYLYDLIARRAPAPSKTFLETPEGRKLTFADLAAGSARMANALAARGVVAGDRVAVQVDKSPDAILLYLACLRAGAVFCR